MGSLTLRALARMGLLRGLLRGSRPWLYIGIGATVLNIFGRVAARKPIVVTEVLRPGERVLVSHFKRR